VTNRPRRTLVIAPHADDETLGMGGTIARKLADGEEVTVAIMTGHGEAPHPLWPRETWDTIRAEAAHAMTALGGAALLFRELPASCLTEHPVHDTNAQIASVIADLAPDELYLPYYHDLHRDHGALCYAGLVASRAYSAGGRPIGLVAMYETPTETHLMSASLQSPFNPNHYVEIGDMLDRKLQAWGCYKSQHQAGPTPRSPEALAALARWRGAEIGVTAAEGFMIVRSIRRAAD
jgi:LmbE family N-acetylglucosaminyl deacetylase